MFQRIVVPLDGSRCAERAIPVAAGIARASGGSVVFLRIVPSPVALGKYAPRHAAGWEQEAYETQRAEAASYLACMMLGYASDLARIDIDMGVASGIIQPTIYSTARSEHADLIVMCSHGQTDLKHWLCDSVAQEVACQSPVPVLILHERAGVFPLPQVAHPVRVLVALDGSLLAETALEAAVHLTAAIAAPGEGVLHLLRVVDLPSAEGKWRSQTRIATVMREHASQEAETYLKAVAACLRQGSLAALKFAVTASVIVSTDVAGTIIRQAEHPEGLEHAGGCHLIVMATHGRRDRRRLVMGSMTERVLSASRLTLLMG